MIVTIDGPAGSGKSTVARHLAARLDIAYLDTGAMYRTIGLFAIRQNTPLDDVDRVTELAGRIDMEIECTPTETRVRLAGQDVSRDIRTVDAGQAAGRVAVIQPVRRLLIERQRAVAAQLGSLVADGRDQGSAVFPDASAKFVITASVACRAKRRFDELQSEGQAVTLDQIIEDVQRRDAIDEIQWRALLAPGQAITIDTTEMTLDEVVDRLVAHINQQS